LTDKSADLVDRLTAEVKSEAERRERAERLACAVIEGIVEGITLTTSTGQIVEVNKTFEQRTGYSRIELVGKRWDELPLLSEEDSRKTIAAGIECLEKGRAKDVEVTAIRRDGTEIPILLDYSLITSSQGDQLILTVARDITKLKQAEKVLQNHCSELERRVNERTVELLQTNARLKSTIELLRQNEQDLRDSEARFGAMLLSIGDHLSMMDRDLNIIWANETAKGVFGANILGRKCYETYHQRKEPCEPYPCSLLKAFEDEGVHEHDTQVVDKEGRMLYFHCTASVALRDDKGNPTAVIEISRDVTEIKRAEDMLRHSAKLFQGTFNALTDAVFILDALKPPTINDCNLATEQMFGYTRDEMLGQTTAFLHESEQTLKEFQGILYSAIDKHGYLAPTEHRMKRKDGSVFPTEHIIMPLKADNGERTGWVSVVRNISERKHTEKRLQEAYDSEAKAHRELEAEMKRRVEFTRALIHELKTPITAMMSSNTLLVEELPEGTLLKLAENIQHSIYNLDKRIGELLDIAKGELGVLKLNRSEVDPLKMLRSAAAEMDSELSERGQSLVLKLPRSMTLGWIDEQRMREVILNLLGNASKYSPEGGEIVLRAREDGGTLAVELKDNGPGIARKDMEHIFEPYYRAESDRQWLPGLGLGLALCKRTVERHGGRIWVKSRKGKGSTFGFSVPLTSQDQLKGTTEGE